MRCLAVLLLIFTLFTTTYAWTNEDHEIFDLVTAVESAEGKDTTFYSWLDVSPSATTAEISKAYRKKSMQLHPDKNPGLKNAQERFARLGVVAQILRNTEGRKRYDFFYKNGVPTWRGTGYYYARYRPGLGSVMIFLTIVTSGLQYVIQRINYKNDLVRINRFVQQARTAAWGSKLQPQEGKKRVKVNIGGRSYIDEDGNMIPGRQLDMLVQGEDVYIVEPNGELLPLDAGAASPPSIHRTWFIALLTSLYRKVTKRAQNDANVNVEDEDDSTTSASDVPGSGRSTPVSDAPRAPVAAVKAGGRRRVQTRKRQQK